jgi:hypothetical protein
MGTIIGITPPAIPSWSHRFIRRGISYDMTGSYQNIFIIQAALENGSRLHGLYHLPPGIP